MIFVCICLCRWEIPAKDIALKQSHLNSGEFILEALLFPTLQFTFFEHDMALWHASSWELLTIIISYREAFN